MTPTDIDRDFARRLRAATRRRRLLTGLPVLAMLAVAGFVVWAMWCGVWGQ